MEVNIVEQLFPNVLTVLVQLCSTFVLFLIAKIFLWPSVKKFLDARAEKMQEELALSQQAKEEALADRKVALEQLNTASTKSEEIVSAAIQQAKQEKKQILAPAALNATSTISFFMDAYISLRSASICSCARCFTAAASLSACARICFFSCFAC